MATSTPAAAGKATIAIDPVTRIEGHLKAEVVVEKGKVVDARVSGGMYRGFEVILQGRDPRDATQLVQRLCGVCPTSHSTCSALAQDEAFKVKITENARVIRNLIFGANYLQSHILHFYHLAALDFVKGPETAPFVPRFKEADLRLPDEINKVAVDQYLEALEVRRIAHEMVALFGGRMPHVHGIVAGGTTEIPIQEKLVEYGARFLKVKEFIETKYLPVVYTVGSLYKDLFSQGQGHKNCISFGAFPMGGNKMLMKPGVYINGKDMAFDPKKIKEDVKYSWFADQTTGLPYDKGQTVPDVNKKDAYSFVKAPRYDNKPVEAGPLARMWIANPELSAVGQRLLKEKFGLNAKTFRDIGADLAFSIMGRHVARAEEALLVANAVVGWLKEVKPGEETWTKFELPASGEGLGLTEAPRGSLLHYLRVADKKIDNYNILAATIWNVNPRDDKGVRGPIEEALIGVEVKDIDNPVNVARLIRAFDP
jgi:hydrogenase large subunit